MPGPRSVAEPAFGLPVPMTDATPGPRSLPAPRMRGPCSRPATPAPGLRCRHSHPCRARVRGPPLLPRFWVPASAHLRRPAFAACRSCPRLAFRPPPTTPLPGPACATGLPTRARPAFRLYPPTSGSGLGLVPPTPGPCSRLPHPRPVRVRGPPLPPPGSRSGLRPPRLSHARPALPVFPPVPGPRSGLRPPTPGPRSGLRPPTPGSGPGLAPPTPGQCSRPPLPVPNGWGRGAGDSPSTRRETVFAASPPRNRAVVMATPVGDSWPAVRVMPGRAAVTCGLLDDQALMNTD
jgi:hypothetical protein